MNLEPLELTEQKEEELWNKIKTIPEKKDSLARGSRELLRVYYQLKTAQFFEIEDKGLASITDLTINAAQEFFNGIVHFTFWDNSLYDDLEVGRCFVDFLFSALRIKRLTAFVPVQHDKMYNYLKGIGFTQEGIMKQFILYGNDPVTVRAMRLLKEEK